MRKRRPWTPTNADLLRQLGLSEGTAEAEALRAMHSEKGASVNEDGWLCTTFESRIRCDAWAKAIVIATWCALRTCGYDKFDKYVRDRAA